MANHARVLIIGSGPAGYTAAIYAARAMLEPVLITGLEQGGQMATTTDVENYPGFPDVIQGPWLMEQMRAQAAHVGTRFISGPVVKVELHKRPFGLVLDNGGAWTCDALIIASGAKARWLGLPSEQHFRGAGVSACATCDGFFFSGQHVLVVGGGNTAVEEALYLSNIAAKVTLIHRRSELRAERLMQQRLHATSNIDVIFDSTVSEVLGQQKPKTVTGVIIRNTRTGDATELKTDGLFVAIGHEPATDLFKGQLRLKGESYIWTEADSTRTNISGVFAAGDVTDDIFRQAVTAAGMGCMAALEAERYIHGLSALSEAAE